MTTTQSVPGSRLWTALIALLLLGCEPALPPQPAPRDFELGLWVWSNQPAIDDTAAASLLSLAQDASLTTLYVQAQTLVYDAPAALHQLVVRAASANLRVELLIGKPTWSQVANFAEALQVARDLASFAAQEKGPHSVALQVNVEPHALPEWPTSQALLLGNLLDLLDQLRPIAHNAKLDLSFDMPTWYDSIALTRHGQTRPASEWVIDAVDTVVLMDYDDDVTDIVSKAASELDYAAKVNKRLIIGLETQCQLDDDVTFCEEGAAALWAELDQVHQQLKAHPAYAGRAIHHWKSLLALPK